MNQKIKTGYNLCSITILLLILLSAPFITQAANFDEIKEDLENQIKQKQQEINQYQQKIQENKHKERTLSNEIEILEDQISQIQIEARQLDLVIQQSTFNIQEIDVEINELNKQIDQKKDLLAEYIRMVALYDQYTLLEMALRNDKFSDFFNQLSALENVQEQTQGILVYVHELKSEFKDKRDELESEREEQNRLKSLQLIQKRTVENKQWQKEDLLEQTKGEEYRFQQLIKNAESAILNIAEQISFLADKDEAIQYAVLAASKTGIRPAFLLGVLEAESRLGLNVGTGNWKKDMYQCYQSLGYLTRAEKEKTAFLQICHELGINPDSQPVSAEPWYGCGGAMGIAQFMPTTWLAYRDQVASLTGHNPPSPWNHQDAFMAAAIKLANGGATQKNEIGERTAYAKYLGGGYYSRWVYSKVTDYVIQLTANFQEQYFD
ncbi:MAG: hypothetical protein AVO34_02325 [Firmicutes bacterium ML8_F2]|jgi:peptidoglycan hydrolase CwlO-like protein|nr:MAG: hypothetical protein AVO34_02325 [Firmicutes bacterium ML8_F2]